MQKQKQKRQLPKSKKEVAAKKPKQLTKPAVKRPLARARLTKEQKPELKVPIQALNPDAFPVLNMEGREVSQIKLDKHIFDAKTRPALLYQAVNMYKANLRQGNASTKTRGEVSGGGIKPWRQKGTGRARVGSIRSPLWRHGGIIFGPHPKDYSYTLSQRMRNEALRASLNTKLKSADLLLLDDLKLASAKTKEVLAIMQKLNIRQKCLILTKDLDTNLFRASRNISFVDVDTARNVNAYEILRHKKLISTVEALRQLSERLTEKE